MRDGSFFEPVAGERFDLIATNPPFVISPATGERLVYRDSGLPGDRVVEHIVRTGARPPHRRRLAAGPRQLGDRRRPAVGRAARGRGCATTATRWSCSASRSTRRRTSSCGSRTAGITAAPDYAAALRHLAVVARRAGHRGRRLRLDQRPAAAGEAPRPARVAATTSSSPSARRSRVGRGGDGLREVADDELLRSLLRARDDVQQETVGRPGAEDPETIVLRQQRGFRRARHGRHGRGGPRRRQRRRPVGRPAAGRDRARCCSATRPTCARPTCRSCGELVGEGFLVLD